MLNFISFIIVVVSVLQIVLFFKIWKMTNDVRKIKKKLMLILKSTELTKYVLHY